MLFNPLGALQPLPVGFCFHGHGLFKSFAIVAIGSVQPLYPGYTQLCLQSYPTHSTPWTVACRRLCLMEFSRQKYWVGYHALLPGILAQGSNPGLLHWSGSLPSEATRSPPWASTGSWGSGSGGMKNKHFLLAISITLGWLRAPPLSHRAPARLNQLGPVAHGILMHDQGSNSLTPICKGKFPTSGPTQGSPCNLKRKTTTITHTVPDPMPSALRLHI